MYLVNDTLDYFQIKSGKFNKKETTFSIQEVVDNIFELIQV